MARLTENNIQEAQWRMILTNSVVPEPAGSSPYSQEAATGEELKFDETI
jgi:hypothetical protein